MTRLNVALVALLLALLVPSAKAQELAFDTGRALATIKELADLGTRACAGGTEKLAFIRMQAKLESYGLPTYSYEFKLPAVTRAPFLMPFNWTGGPNGVSRVMVFGHAGAGKPVLLVAHLDSINGPGANDNASGSAVLIELARVNRNKSGVLYALVGCEEAGALGSFWMSQVFPSPAAVVAVDMVGERWGDTLLVNGYESILVTSLGKAVTINGKKVITKVEKFTPVLGTSDHWSWAMQEVPAAIIGWPDERCRQTFPGCTMSILPDVMHTSEDTYERIDPQAIMEVGEVLLYWINTVDVKVFPKVAPKVRPNPALPKPPQDFNIPRPAKAVYDFPRDRSGSRGAVQCNWRSPCLPYSAIKSKYYGGYGLQYVQFR